MSHQVFISYGHQDKLVADAACARLEARGIRCWIAPRDVLPGQAYGEAINSAIRGCRALVLVFSSNANLSEHVSKEVERAVSNAIPVVVPLRIENVAPTGALEYFIGSVHWLDALTRPIENHLEYLADSIQSLIGGLQKKPGPTPIPGPHPTPKPLGLYAAIAVLALLLVGVLVYTLGGRSDPPNSNANVAPPPAVNPAPSPPPAPPSATPAGIAGCWVYNNVNLRFTPNGQVTGFSGDPRWRAKGGNRYSITWPAVADTFQIPPDGKSLSGTNNYGPAISARRISPGGEGAQNFAGTWLWSNSLTVVANSNGTATTSGLQGRWSSLGGGTYKVEWDFIPVDELVLSPDGQRLAGQNNAGAAVGGTRTGCPN